MYKKLEIDYELPEFLAEDIDAMLKYMNENSRHLSVDLHQSNLRSDINSCDDLPREIADELKRYYCNGGIYYESD